MPYTTEAKVQAQAGNLLDDLTANPTSAELAVFITRVDGTIDGYLSGQGFTAPTTDATALAALDGPATDGVTVLALEARFHGGDTPPALVSARERWAAALASLADGTHPAVVSLGYTNTGVGAGSFAADEAANYTPTVLDYRNTGETFNTNTDNELYEGMPL